jgi:hypothetical protein
MTALVVLAVPTIRWPTKQIRFPPTRNHRRPRRSVFAPLKQVREIVTITVLHRTTYAIIKHMVIEIIHAETNQTYAFGSPNSAEIRGPTAAMAGTGIKEMPYPRDRIWKVLVELLELDTGTGLQKLQPKSLKLLLVLPLPQLGLAVVQWEVVGRISQGY